MYFFKFYLPLDILDTRHLSHTWLAHIFSWSAACPFMVHAWFSQHKTSGSFRFPHRKVWRLLESAGHGHSLGRHTRGQIVGLIPIRVPSFAFTMAHLPWAVQQPCSVFSRTSQKDKLRKKGPLLKGKSSMIQKVSPGKLENAPSSV